MYIDSTGKKYYKEEVTSLSYDSNGEIELTFAHMDYIYFINPKDVKFGGQNCEIHNLRSRSRGIDGRTLSGSIVLIPVDSISHLRSIKQMTVLSDGICEVDETGKLIKW